MDYSNVLIFIILCINVCDFTKKRLWKFGRATKCNSVHALSKLWAVIELPHYNHVPYVYKGQFILIIGPYKCRPTIKFEYDSLFSSFVPIYLGKCKFVARHSCRAWWLGPENHRKVQQFGGTLKGEFSIKYTRLKVP